MHHQNDVTKMFPFQAPPLAKSWLRPCPCLIQHKLHFYAVVLRANLRCSNAANLILSFFVSHFSSNGLRHGPRPVKNDRNDFDEKGTSCNASIFKNPVLVGCSAFVQCNKKFRIACKCVGKYF